MKDSNVSWWWALLIARRASDAEEGPARHEAATAEVREARRAEERRRAFIFVDEECVSSRASNEPRQPAGNIVRIFIHIYSTFYIKLTFES